MSVYTCNFIIVTGMTTYMGTTKDLLFWQILRFQHIKHAKLRKEILGWQKQTANKAFFKTYKLGQKMKYRLSCITNQKYIMIMMTKPTSHSIRIWWETTNTFRSVCGTYFEIRISYSQYWLSGDCCFEKKTMSEINIPTGALLILKNSINSQTCLIYNSS